MLKLASALARLRPAMGHSAALLPLIVASLGPLAQAAHAAAPEFQQETDLELWDGRFTVRVTFTDGLSGPRTAQVSSARHRSAVLHFFHPTNPELMVKILDGREINGHFWFLYGAITTLAVELELEDRVTGVTRTYRKAEGWPQGAADVAAFPDSSSTGTGVAAQIRPPTFAPTPMSAPTSGRCVPDASTLCFQAGRFRVTGSWRLDGSTSIARVAPGSDRSGYLWFFDPDNPEVLIKILDGRPINDSFWVMFGSATHLPFRLVVTDLETGIAKSFPGDEFGGGADVFSFGPHGDHPAPPDILLPADGDVVNPHDPALWTDARSSASDSGCLDYRIQERTPAGERLVWRADCLRGAESYHPHLEEGNFVDDSVAAGKLAGETEHRLLVRQRRTEADGEIGGPWAEQTFRTGPIEGVVYSLVAGGALDLPAPTWKAGGEPVHLPDASCVLRMQSGIAPILSFQSARDGEVAECQVASPPAEPAAVRVTVGDCTRRLRLPASEIRWRTSTGRSLGASLPDLDLSPGDTARFDVSSGGSSFFAVENTSGILDLERLARHSASPWWLAPGLEIERIHTPGLALPVNLTPGPGLRVPAHEASPDDPLFYITELYGTIRVLRRDEGFGTFVDELLDFDPTGDFPGSGEMGLVGTAIDPTNGDLLATLVYPSTNPDPLFGFSGRVVRLPSDDGGRTAAGVETVLDLGPETRQSRAHQISHLSFGPDGMLYVHVGDGFAFQQSQDLDSFAGKILRLRPDGTAPTDNPFYDATDGITAADYLYSLGMRNPFGGDWGPDGRLYVAENGLSVDRLARIEPGFNYAWGQNGEGTDEQMRVGALFNWPEAVTPFDLLFMPAGPSSLPEDWSGKALVSEFGPTYGFGATRRGKRLVLFDLDDGPIQPRTVLRYDGQGPATVAAAAVVSGTPEHDGLYFVDFFPEPFDDPEADPAAPGARLWRVRVQAPTLGDTE
ncbi:MAG: PQQ-dependent sugar dehydrogenase [Thermoanaerobaculia bacterium]|nr:PQQ-dependent sugar dehydrogenase [Thermoanaerobaculia bacterium]